MYVEYDTDVKIRDIGINNKIKNTSIIAYLEDTACKHSNLIKLGLIDMNKRNLTWIILNWKIKMFERPEYGEKIKIVTWVRNVDKICVLRDFEIINSDGKIIGIATSKWALINMVEKKLVKLTSEISEKYEIEEKEVFPNYQFDKKRYLDNLEYISDINISQNWIDINEHVHNVFYLDIANEAISYEDFKNIEFNEIEISYKKEIRYGTNVKLFYKIEGNEHIIIIKSGDGKSVHSIVKYTTVS